MDLEHRSRLGESVSQLVPSRAGITRPPDRHGSPRWGCSDRFSPSDVPPFEVLVDDLLLVMQAAGAERPVLLATAECAATAALFAATYPDRIAALVLCDPLVTFASTEDAPGLMSRAEVAGLAGRGPNRIPQTPLVARSRGSSRTGVVGAVTPGRRLRRAGSARSSAGSLRRTCGRSCRPCACRRWCSLIRTARTTPIRGTAGIVADRIPGARLIEVAGSGGLSWNHWYGRADGIMSEVGPVRPRAL
jgi:pimeloyl-ACP methyl ester carboxylesterase